MQLIHRELQSAHWKSELRDLETFYTYLQGPVMLLGSFIQLSPLARVVSSPSDVLSMEVGPPSGEWVVVAICVPCYIFQLEMLLVGQLKEAMPSQLHLGLGLEQVALPSHHH